MKSKIAVFFYIDIVASSKSSPYERKKKIETLNKVIKESRYFKSLPSTKEEYVSQAGDGIAICFPSDLSNKFDKSIIKAINLALYVHKRLGKYNKKLLSKHVIKVRIGISRSEVVIIRDIFGNMVHSGDGMIISNRIMEIGRECQILLSEEVVTNLKTHGPEKLYEQLCDLGEYVLKHGIKKRIWLFLIKR